MRFFGAIVSLAIFIALIWITDPAHAQNGQWGTVKGTITWGGKEIPKQMQIAQVAGHQDKAACTMNGNVVIDETWVVNPKNKGLEWTFVWLVDPNKKGAPPIHPNLKAVKEPKVVMDQPLCHFTPHGIALREGQVLVAKNSAGIAHNFKWTGNPATPNAGNNVLIAPGGSFEIKGLVSDRFPIKIECNIHPWMNGWVRVFDHPYFAVTDKDGKFEMKDAPAGNYNLMIWHGSGGWLGGAAGKNGKAITIKAGGVTDLGDMPFPPPN